MHRPSRRLDETNQICGVAVEENSRTSTAVVRALRAGESVFRPTVWGTVDVEQGVLLLKTEPGFVILGEVHDLGGMVTVVGLVGSAVVVVTLGEDEDVVTLTEGILEDGSGPQVDIGVATRGLVGGRTVEIPDTQLSDISDFLVHSLYDNNQTTHQGIYGSKPTQVLERRPPSPSTQTSAYMDQFQR